MAYAHLFSMPKYAKCYPKALKSEVPRISWKGVLPGKQSHHEHFCRRLHHLGTWHKQTSSPAISWCPSHPQVDRIHPTHISVKRKVIWNQLIVITITCIFRAKVSFIYIWVLNCAKQSQIRNAFVYRSEDWYALILWKLGALTKMYQLKDNHLLKRCIIFGCWGQGSRLEVVTRWKMLIQQFLCHLSFRSISNLDGW